MLDTKSGLLFIDFENTARGPVEYDLAWVPDDVSKHYPGSTEVWSTSAGGSYSRSSPRIAGVATTNTRAEGNQEWRSSTFCATVRHGRHSTMSSGDN